MIVVAVAKFAEGAWVTVLLIPAIMAAMMAIRRHYRLVEAEVANPAPLDLSGLQCSIGGGSDPLLESGGSERSAIRPDAFVRDTGFAY